ncbi:arabinofuranosidase catalytic domain-containing protein [Mucilaginibacter calamicampi]|uniref:Arabinofuranosidase catalytic domain-containing protein n=1 Tax=Mucilaginibacter calamicampi TaxID=1302352 RepID=A0ABW2YZ17_9SPHI
MINQLLTTLKITAVTLPSALMVMSMSGNPMAALERPEGTCDIYARGGTPCVAAHSTTRALYKAYNGPLYRVMRESDGQSLDIGIVKATDGDAGGYADAAAQDAFCAGALCRITTLYDQSGKGNHLTEAPPGTFKGPEKGAYDALPIADMAPVTVSGHKAYGVFIMPGMGLRNNNARDLAINDEPEGIYYVINGKHYDSGCCFDYGNSSTNSRAVGTGTMETTYYGNATAWGSGNGAGPWIMADMEAGLFSGFNAKKNDVPSIDGWRFVSAFVDGGGGNKWDLRGGDAQKGKLTTYYDGVRPGTPGSSAYYPMHKKGGVLLGNGGDNGAGSSGTFYEGVMTTGYPTMATTDAVQANIVAAKYDVERLSVSRAKTFTPKASQDVNVKFTNTTGAPVSGLKLSIVPLKGWTATVDGTATTSKTFTYPVPAGATVNVTFKVTAPANAELAFLSAKADWAGAQSDITTQRVRSALPVKINEVRFGTGNNLSNQFVELYNSSSSSVDISNWKLINTRSEWGAVKMATIPAGTKIKAGGFYVLGLATSGIVAPVKAGDGDIYVQNIDGLAEGQVLDVDGETRRISRLGTAAAPATTVYIPVSTSSRLTIPAGSTNIPVTSAAGFVVGEKIGIDMGGKYEVAMVTAVGKAGTQANLSVAAKAGETVIKVTDNSAINVGDALSINTGARIENVKVKRIISTYTAPARGAAPGAGGEIELDAPLKKDHMVDVDVFGKGTGISFTPALRFDHKSADLVQALGSGITLNNYVARAHEEGAPLHHAGDASFGYQGQPNQWFGIPLSNNAGSIALMDASGKVLVDGMVYGSQQSSSSANGTIASTEIATLEGEQGMGGCIVVLPWSTARPQPSRASATDLTNRSVGRYPDGNDSDSNCGDFYVQNTVNIVVPAAAGSNNIKVASVANLAAGQKLIIGSGANAENIVISNVGTTGATTTIAAINAGETLIPVSSVAGFAVGQTITIGSGASTETAIIGTVTAARRGFGGPPAAGAAATPGNSVTLTAPLKNAQAAGVQVSGSGVTLAAALTKAHNAGTQVASAGPTPGAANVYAVKK